MTTDQPTDQPTDGRTDGRTDKASYRVASPRLKRSQKNYNFDIERLQFKSQFLVSVKYTSALKRYSKCGMLECSKQTKRRDTLTVTVFKLHTDSNLRLCSEGLSFQTDAKLQYGCK